MSEQLRISRHLIKAPSMKGSNAREEAGKGNSEDSEAMQGAEDFKENVVRSSEIRERYCSVEKERGAIHSEDKKLLEINHLK